jgi:hypothetical protein
MNASPQKNTTLPVTLDDSKPASDKQPAWENFSAPSIPPYFSLAGPWQVMPGEEIRLKVASRLAGEMELNIFRVVTPVELLSVLPHLSPAELPAGVRKSLAMAKAKASGQQPTTGDGEMLPGEFVWLTSCRHVFHGPDGTACCEMVRLPALPKGIYIVEATLGPQAAYWPCQVSSLLSLAVSVPGMVQVWLCQAASGEAASNLPIFYADRRADWRQAVTDSDGMAKLPLSAGHWWILARSEGRLHALSVDVPEVQPPLGQTTTPVAAPPLWRIPTTVPAATHHLRLTRQKQWLATGETMAVELWSSASSARQEVGLWRQTDDGNEYVMVDRQERFTQQGKAQYFFVGKEAGTYQVRAGEAAVSFTVYAPTEPLPYLAVIDAVCRSEEGLSLILPGRNVHQWLMVRDRERIHYSELLPPFHGNRALRVPPLAACGELSVNLFYLQGHQWLQECWRVMAQHGSIEITMPDRADPQTPATLLLHWQNNSGIAVSGYTELLQPGTSRLPAFNKTPLPVPHTEAFAITLPQSYQEWAYKKMTANYGEALLASQEHRYAEAIRLCRRLLQIVPDEVHVTELLAAAIAQSGQATSKEAFLGGQPQFSVLLEQNVTFARRSLSFSQFVAKLAEDTGVCMEIASEVYDRLSAHLRQVDDLPAQADARTILNYTLARRSLVYKMENGVLYIIEAAAQLDEVLLSLLDHRLAATPLPISPLDDAKKMPATASPPPDRQPFMSDPHGHLALHIALPTPGIWLLRLVWRDTGGAWHCHEQHIFSQMF